MQVGLIALELEQLVTVLESRPYHGSLDVTVLINK